MHFLRDPPGVIFDYFHIFLGNVDRGQDAGRVAGVDPGQLNMLHDSGNKGVGAVADGICLAFHGMI